MTEIVNKTGKILAIMKVDADVRNRLEALEGKGTKGAIGMRREVIPISLRT